MGKLEQFLDEAFVDAVEYFEPRRMKREHGGRRDNPHQMHRRHTSKAGYGGYVDVPDSMALLEQPGPLRDVEIGSRILFRNDRDSKLRPGIVYAVWRDRFDQQIKKIELLPSTRNLSTKFPSDFVLSSEDLCERFKSDSPCRVMMRTVVMIDNTREFLPNESKQLDVSIDTNLWPEILVRRAQALLYSLADPVVMMNPVMSPEFVREGFTFGNLDLPQIFSGIWSPDIKGGHFGRRPSSILDPQVVDTLAEYSASIHAIEMKKASGGTYYTFPSLDEWEDVPFAPLPNWDRVKGSKVSNASKASKAPEIYLP